MKEWILLAAYMQISQDRILPLPLANTDIEWLLCCDYILRSFVTESWNLQSVVFFLFVKVYSSKFWGEEIVYLLNAHKHGFNWEILCCSASRIVPIFMLTINFYLSHLEGEKPRSDSSYCSLVLYFLPFFTSVSPKWSHLQAKSQLNPQVSSTLW